MKSTFKVKAIQKIAAMICFAALIVFSLTAATCGGGGDADGGDFRSFLSGIFGGGKGGGKTASSTGTDSGTAAATASQAEAMAAQAAAIETVEDAMRFADEVREALGSSSNNAIPLSPNTWANGNIVESGMQQWYRFTATASTQHIHCDFDYDGFAEGAVALVAYYDSSGSRINEYFVGGTQIMTWELTEGQEYQMRIGSIGGGGRYRIGYTNSVVPPATTPSVISANTWAYGNINAQGEPQWYRFTATASTQHFHVSFGSSNSVSVQIYDSDSSEVGYDESLENNKNTFPRTVTQGQEYLMQVRSRGGTYQIAFTGSDRAPPVTIPANAILLNANTWADGNISASDEPQWFRFTASANTHYIHYSFGTLTVANVQVYTSDGAALNTTNSMSGSGISSSSSRRVSSGQVYYIKVWPSGNRSGTYQIAVNTTNMPPLPDTIIPLSANTWANGDIPTANGQQWFSFTPTGSSQYIHASFGTLTDLNITVYNSAGAEVGGSTSRLRSNTRFASRTSLSNQTYYIKVWPYANNASGTYQIAFSATNAAPQ